MQPKIDRQELAEVVEETARLEEADRGLVDEPEARQILRELDLPAERLDEARRAVAVRREERSLQRKRGLVALALPLACGAAIAVGAWRHHATTVALSLVTASEATLTVQGAPVALPLARATHPEVVFDVVLAQAPEGASLDLSCRWTGPDGSVHHQNRWTTKEVDHDHWPTHCRHAFGETDAAGAWSVTLADSEHDLATRGFSLK